MKAILLGSFLLMASTAHAKGHCIAYDSLYQPLCSQQPMKEACNARTNVCKWVEVDGLGHFVNRAAMKAAGFRQ